MEAHLILLFVLQGCDPHILPELIGERTLVIETKMQGNIRKRHVPITEKITGGVNPHFYHELLRGGVKIMLKFPFKLTNGQIYFPGKVLH